MELLLNWLNSEVRLSERIADVDRQFANGFLFGEVLSKYNQILEFEAKFANSETKAAVVQNYCQIFAILQTMKVKFNSNTALAIIRGTPNSAVLLLRALKDHLEKTKGLVDYQIQQKTGSPNIVFPLKQFETQKENFDSMEQRLFKERLEKELPAQKALEMQKKLQKYEDLKSAASAKAENERAIAEAAEESLRDLRHNQLQETLSKAIKFKKNWLEEGAKHWRENQQVFHERRMQEERFGQSRENRIKTRQLSTLDKQNAKVRDEIAEFEARHLKKTTLCASQEGSGADHLLVTSKDQKMKLIADICNAIDIKLIRDGVRLREKETHSEITRKEKDRRLRKMIMDFKKWQAVKDVGLLKENAMLDILRESRQEEEIRYEFFKAKCHQNVFLENRALRDQTCKEKLKELQGQARAVKQRNFESLMTDFDNNTSFCQREEKRVEDGLHLQEYDKRYHLCRGLSNLLLELALREAQEGEEEGFKMLAELRTELSSEEVEKGGESLGEKAEIIQKIAFEEFVTNRREWALGDALLQEIESALKENGLETSESSQFSVEMLSKLILLSQRTGIDVSKSDKVYQQVEAAVLAAEAVDKQRIDGPPPNYESLCPVLKVQSPRDKAAIKVPKSVDSDIKTVTPNGTSTGFGQQAEKGSEDQKNEASQRSSGPNAELPADCQSPPNVPRLSKAVTLEAPADVKCAPSSATSEKRLSRTKRSMSFTYLIPKVELYQVNSRRAVDPFTSDFSVETVGEGHCLPKFPSHLPLKLVILGPTFSFKTYIAKHLSERYSLKVISVQETLSELIRINQFQALADKRASSLLDKLFRGEPLDNADKTYVVRQVLLYSFDTFQTDEDYALHLINVKALNLQKQAKSYVAAKAERRKRQSQFWKKKSMSQEFVIDKLTIERLNGFGFVLLDFPDELGTAVELEKMLSGFLPDDEVQLTETQQTVAAVADVYPEVKEELATYIDRLGREQRETVDVTAVFKMKKEYRSFFDAVFVISCKSEDAYKRAFESYVSEPDEGPIQLRNVTPSEVQSIDFGKLRFNVQPSENAFSLCEALKHQEINIAQVCDFYQHFRARPGTEESIVYAVDDSDLTEAIEKSSAVIESILDRKTAHFNSLLEKHFANRVADEANAFQVEKLSIRRRQQSKLADEEAKELLSVASQRLAASSLMSAKSSAAQQMIALWADAANSYRRRVSALLFQTQSLQLMFQRDVNRLLNKGIDAIVLSDDRDVSLNAFIKEYNDFAIQLPDLICLEEVKAEFHYRCY